jgi:hypothetical protein
MGAKIQILIDGQEAAGVSYVSVYVKNQGLKKVRNVKLSFLFPGASVYKYKWIVNSIYNSNLKTGKVWRNAVELEISYMDGSQLLKGDFLLARYNPGTIKVQATSSEEEIRLERGEVSTHLSKDGLNLLPLIALIALSIVSGLLFSRVLPFLAEYFVLIQER